MMDISEAYVFGLRPEMIFAYCVANSVYNHYGLECRLTCGATGVHKEKSLHWAGMAIDLGLKGIEGAMKVELHREIDKRLSPEFDCLLELGKPHIHIEFQPKLKRRATK